jgi:ADP-ribose pyrophosphatase YjhB (NUDIX family)
MAARAINLDQRALILNQDGNVLLVKVEDGDWDLPGGLLVDGKNWREGLEELLEEQVNLSVMTKQPVYAADTVHPTTGEYTYMTVIECLAFGDEAGSSEFSELSWVTPEKISELEFATYDTRQALLDFFFAAGS